MPELPQGRAGPCDQRAWDEGARPSLFGSRKGSRWLGFLWKCSPSLLPNAQSPGWKQDEVRGLLRLELAPCLAPQAIPWTEGNVGSRVHAAGLTPLISWRVRSMQQSVKLGRAREPSRCSSLANLLCILLGPQQYSHLCPLWQRENVNLCLLPPWRGQLGLNHDFLQLHYVFL